MSSAEVAVDFPKCLRVSATYRLSASPVPTWRPTQRSTSRPRFEPGETEESGGLSAGTLTSHLLPQIDTKLHDNARLSA